MNVDEVQKGISPNLLVRKWPPALPEWSTKSVRDSFYASPLLPRLLSPEVIKETIARGFRTVRSRMWGRTGMGTTCPSTSKKRSLPWTSECRRRCTSSRRSARKRAAHAARILSSRFRHNRHFQVSTPTRAAAGTADGAFGRGSAPTGGQSEPKSGPEPVRLPLALTWPGEVPPQKWMDFYTKVLTKVGVANELRLNVRFMYKLSTGMLAQKLVEIRSALRELGLSDQLGSKFPVNCRATVAVVVGGSAIDSPWPEWLQINADSEPSRPEASDSPWVRCTFRVAE